jgi:hypothetical protein
MTRRLPLALSLALVAAATTGCPSVADTTKLLNDLQKAAASASPSAAPTQPAKSPSTSASSSPSASPGASSSPTTGDFQFTSFYYNTEFDGGDTSTGFTFEIGAGGSEDGDVNYDFSAASGTITQDSRTSAKWVGGSATGDVAITVKASGPKGSVTGTITVSKKETGWAVTKVDLPGLKGAPEDFTGCLAAGTLVRLADGREVPIERIQVGDAVEAYDQDGRHAAKALVEKVLVHPQSHQHLAAVRTADGHALQATLNHPILTPGGWRQVAELTPGSVVYVYDAGRDAFVETKVVSIVRDASEAGVVYNLKTSLHDYVAAEILVHNKCLAAGAPIDTPTGPVRVEDLEPGMWVYGDVDGQRVATRVTNVYRKATVAEALPGKRLTPNVAATINHLVMQDGMFAPAGDGDWADEAIAGEVFDVQTALGNYSCDGLLMTASGVLAATR